MSPSKPRMTSILRRRAHTSPADTTAGSTAPRISSTSTPRNGYPDTPPTSPDRSSPDYYSDRPSPPRFIAQAGTATAKLSKEAREQQAFNRIRSRSTWSMTPLSSGSPTPKGRLTTRPASSLLETNTVRQTSPAYARKRPSTPIPFSSPPPPKSASPRTHISPQILTNLETALRSQSSDPKLHLDDPALDQLLQLSNDHAPSLRDPSNTKPGSRSPPTNTTISLLQQIFPSTPLPLLSSLHATLLCQQHLPYLLNDAGVRTASSGATASPSALPSSPTFPPSTQQNQQQHPPLNYPTTTTSSSSSSSPFLAPHVSPPPPPHPLRRSTRRNSLSIPSKARAMLGLLLPPPPPPPPPSAPLPETQPQRTATRWEPHTQQQRTRSRPPLPSYWIRHEAEQWGERVRDVERLVEKEVGRVLGMVVRGEEEGMGCLGRAVGEVVRVTEKGGGGRGG